METTTMGLYRVGNQKTLGLGFQAQLPHTTIQGLYRDYVVVIWGLYGGYVGVYRDHVVYVRL